VDHGIDGTNPVHKGLHLAVERTETNRAGQDHDIGREYFLQNFIHIVLLDARYPIGDARTATGAIVEVLLCQSDFLHMASSLLRPFHELIA